jgi:signal transduction histidine kinase
MIIGSINLLGRNFLAEIADTRIGKGGYLYISDSNRTLIVHPDKGRIMKPAASPGVNAFYDKAIKGFEGSGETTTSYGVHMFSACKRLRVTSWILAVNFPTAEVYAPLHTAKRYFDASSIALTIMLLIATWLITRRLMSPLAAMTRHVELLSQKEGDERLIAVDAVNEIGGLATAFNTMIATLDRQRDKLEELNNSLEERILAAVAEIRHKDQMLIQQSRQAAMGEMINNIAHQWRQPLNNVGLIVQNLLFSFESGTLTGEEMRTEIATTMETIQFMSRTIDDFRNFFRQDKEKRTFAITDILSLTIDFVSAGFRDGNITVNLEISDGITAHGYPNEYSQVLLNILNNAKDALTEHRVEEPLITVRLFGDNRRAIVAIRDNGGGIAEDVLPRIFDPYFSTKEPGKGTGIGLYMSKVIIEQNMGGSLSARNVDGGAEFRIEILSAGS